jgi:putative Mg2+ transporter-C (MgtC) family protein
MLEYIGEIIQNTEVNASTSIFKLSVSFILGVIIGMERQSRRRDAGIRTFTLICVGSTVAMLVSIWIPQTYSSFQNGDPGRIAAQVLTGIGFLGAGAIIRGHGSIQGLTTAACIWLMSAIGLAIGAGMYLEAVVATTFTLFALLIMELFERRFLLDGVNKILSISCNTSSPDTDKIRKILDDQKVIIISRSFDYNYEKNITQLTYKVNIKHRNSYSGFFNEFLKLGYVSGVRLLA